jgi:3-deoxy-manno-octulosonate cytidylyltransferase (CMP-KDO synthetase)
MFYKHIGIYGYGTDILEKITKLPQSDLELAEKLEQNRWIENGYKIKVAISPYDSIGIDTKEDIEAARMKISKSISRYF